MAEPFPPAGSLEPEAFRTLNSVVEPLVRAGIGGPLLSPFGAIVLEACGRKTGAVQRTPLLATVLDGVTIVATFRGARSQWVKNLAAGPEVAWWVNGMRRSGRAVVFAPGLPCPPEADIPENLQACAGTAWRGLVAGGWAVAVLFEGTS